MENVNSTFPKWTITEYTHLIMSQSVHECIEQPSAEHLLLAGFELGTAETKMVSTWSPPNTVVWLPGTCYLVLSSEAGRTDLWAAETGRYSKTDLQAAAGTSSPKGPARLEFKKPGICSPRNSSCLLRLLKSTWSHLAHRGSVGPQGTLRNGAAISPVTTWEEHLHMPCGRS